MCILNYDDCTYIGHPPQKQYIHEYAYFRKHFFFNEAQAYRFLKYHLSDFNKNIQLTVQIIKFEP